MKTNKCDTCYYWSQLIAQSIGCGPIEAMCLNDSSNNYQKMTYEKMGCNTWKDSFGIDYIDLPFRKG